LRLATIVLVATFCLACGCATQHVPRAVIADPPPDAKSTARMEVIHIPSGGVQINGVVYVASGPSPHPTFVLFHELPGNEKNLDLAQAVRRAGWTVVTVNYRGSWGSPETTNLHKTSKMRRRPLPTSEFRRTPSVCRSTSTV
jgi:uncharacterized protein